MRGLIVRGIGQGVTQYQTAFGVGIENLYGLATHAGHHIAGLDSVGIGHVFAAWNQCHHVHLRLQLTNGLHGTQYAGSTAHVVLHLVHIGAGLDGNTTSVKRDAFANQHHRRLRLRRTLVLHDYETQRLC